MSFVVYAPPDLRMHDATGRRRWPIRWLRTSVIADPAASIRVSDRPDNPTPGAAAPSLTQRTMHGYAWLVVQTVGTRIVSIAGTVALTHLLAKEHWGLIGLVFTVTALTWRIEQIGLREVLVHRHRALSRWRDAAMSLSLTLGIVSSVLTAALAPLAALLYGRPGVVGPILLLALTPVVTALSTVPDAQLRAELRFRELAIIGTVVGVATVVLTVGFALLGFGVYSFALPFPIVRLGRTIAVWWLTKPPLRFGIDLRRWRLLMPHTGYALVASYGIYLIAYGDYIALGLLGFTTAAIGIYYAAFRFSVQALQMLAQNLMGVLFPALSTLQDDPVRQAAAFVRATRALALVAAPLCLLQIPLARPLVELLLDPEFHDAAHIIEILSFGVMVRVVTSPVESLLQSQGRFGTYAAVYAAYGILFTEIVLIGAIMTRGASDIAPIAWAVTIAMSVCGPVTLAVGLRRGGRGWRDVPAVLGAPIAVSAAVVGVAWAASLLVPEMPGRRLLQIVVTLVVFTALGLPALRWAMPGPWEELTTRLGAARRGRRAAGVATGESAPSA